MQSKDRGLAQPQRRSPYVMVSEYSAILRNDFREVLMVLNEQAMIQKHGVTDLGSAFAPKTKGWGFPGGGMKKGEKKGEGAFRETQEETSLEITVSADTPYIETPERDFHKKRLFLVEDYRGTPRPNCEEVCDVQWVPVELFLSKDDREELFFNGEPMYKGHRRMIRQLLREIGVLKD